VDGRPKRLLPARYDAKIYAWLDSEFLLNP
jgi:hypothetical protein